MLLLITVLVRGGPSSPRQVREETGLYKRILKCQVQGLGGFLQLSFLLIQCEGPHLRPLIRTSVTGTGHLEGCWRTRKREPWALRRHRSLSREIPSEVWTKAGGWRRKRTAVSSGHAPDIPRREPHCANNRTFPSASRRPPSKCIPTVSHHPQMH